MNTNHLSLASAQSPPVRTLLTEKQAAEAIWSYYIAHKADLVSNISEHREALLAKTMSGIPVPDVFKPFLAPKLPPPPPPRRKKTSR